MFKSILFLFIEFHCTFSISYILTNYVYYYRILIRIVEAIGLLFFRARFSFFPYSRLFLPSSCVSLPYFILAVPMRECLGKHSCTSSSFPIAILNGTSFFRQCNYKCTKENSVGDGDTSQSTSNPV